MPVAAGFDFESLLCDRHDATQRLSEALQTLSGPERTQALKQCREAGIGVTELAKLAGISRERVYQLLDKSV